MNIYAKMRVMDPTPYYEIPNQVLKDDKLSLDEKAKVLKSMALDADQKLEATAEGMPSGTQEYYNNDLQSALVQLETINEVALARDQSLPNALFQRIMVVTTVDQNLNRDIADVAYGMAEDVGGKVYLLNVVPPEIEVVRSKADDPTVTSVPLITADRTQVIKDHTQRLIELRGESGSSVETKIEVRSGQVQPVIIEYAVDCGADIIVIGSPNRAWIEAFLEQSTARKPTKSPPCPILIVPA